MNIFLKIIIDNSQDIDMIHGPVIGSLPFASAYAELELVKNI